VRSPRGKIRELEGRYAPHDDRPLRGYLATLTGYAAGVAGLVALVVRRGGPPTRLAVQDLALASVATFRASRLLTEASVTAPLRAPFTTFEGPGDPGEVDEQVQEPTGGHRHAVGELLSCPYCSGVWLATGFTFGLLLHPRWARVAASVLAVDAGSEALQKLHSDLQAR
jgi:hypothetical protein